MPSDRGTLPRGLQPAAMTSTRPGRSRRLPPGGCRSAPREREPALAALAVLLILGGALGAGLLVIQGSKRVAAIEISQPVAAGQRIPPSAIQQVQIAQAGSGLAYVPWDKTAPGHPLLHGQRHPAGHPADPGGMVAATGTPVAGKAVLGLALKDGQLPHGLTDGDHIDIYQVSDAQETCPGASAARWPPMRSSSRSPRPSRSPAAPPCADVEVALSPPGTAGAGGLQCRQRGRGHRGPARRGPGCGRRRGRPAGTGPGSGQGSAARVLPPRARPHGPGHARGLVRAGRSTAPASAAPGTGGG